MRTRICLLLSTLCFAAPVAADSFDSAFLQSLDNTHYHEVHDEAIGRSFHVYVKVPAGDPGANVSYPTVYVLDGGKLFPLIASYHDYLSFGDAVPAAIIVGISYGADDFAGGNYRSTDYTAPSEEREYWGGAEAFRDFLETNLIPMIEKNYPARADRRVIFGQSLGGQFVLFSAQTRPSLFWGHIASNAALHRNLDFFLDTNPDVDSDSQLFFATATRDDPRFREPALEWIDRWSAADEKPWDLRVEHLPGHWHMSAPPESYRRGMLWLFRETPTATMAVTDARIWTGDAEQPWAEAMAVDGETILAVGSNAEIRQYVDDATEIIDSGALVVPGFIDTHVHFLDGGESLLSVQLRDVKTRDQFGQRFAEHVKTIEPGEWILGGGWDHEAWGGELPTRAWIDDVTPDNPVWVHRLDGHMALANSIALGLAGVDADSADVAGGEVVRDADGRPTGVLKDNAMLPVFEAIPEPSQEQRDRQLVAALEYLARNGVTTVHDMGTFDHLEVFRRAHRRGELTARIYAAVPLSEWQRLEKDVETHGRGDEWLTTGALKGFMDGSLGSHTAAMIEPFTDEPDDRGMLINTLDDMRSWIEGADAAGLHIAVHAIGDRAIRDLLDIFLDVVEANGPRDRRFRMEHAQHIHPDDLHRFAAQDVIASMQPYHAIDDGRWAERVIGPERALTTYAFRSLVDSGARVAFGSDWYVAPASPILGIHAAVSRETLDGDHPDGWVPAEKVSVDDALRAYTVQAAYASYDEDNRGKLRAGLLADFVVLDKDLTSIEAAAIIDTQVLRTVVGGRTVFEAD
ncbi:MAG: amidohydrolase family protein [Woeseiaceae bacterium]|nr:amidohydrolase family protein [Woeseiaceae bacterium]